MADGTAPPRSRTRGSFAMIPRWVRQRLTHGPDDVALWLYLHLADEYCDADRFCFPTEATLAVELDCHERTIRRALATLVRIGAVRVTRSRKATGHWGRNGYVLPMDDPLDLDMHPAATSEVDLPDQRRGKVCAGRNQRTPHVLPPEDTPCPVVNQTHLKQPDPSTNLEPPMAAPRSKDKHSGFSPPSTRGVDGVEPSLQDLQEPKPSAATDQAGSTSASLPGVEPPNRQEPATHVARPGAVGIKSPAPPDDLVWPDWALSPDDRDEVPAGKIPTLHEQYPIYISADRTDPDYPWGDWEHQRRERLYDLVSREVGGLDGTTAEHAVESMLDQEMHWRKIVNAVRKQYW